VNGIEPIAAHLLLPFVVGQPLQAAIDGWMRRAVDDLSPAAVDGLLNACPALRSFRREAYVGVRYRGILAFVELTGARCGEGPLPGISALPHLA